MDCSVWIAGLSARADGEDPGVDERLLDGHLDGCASCRHFAAEVAALRRRTLLEPAGPMADLAPRVVKLNAVADRAGRWGLVRGLLALVALEMVLVAVPDLLAAHADGGEAAHASRHLGAFAIAYAVGLLVVVVRPARARAMLPVTMVLAGALAVTAALDVAQGRVPMAGELGHLPEMLSVVLVWWLARPARVAALGSRSPGRSSPQARLRLVEHPDLDREAALDREAGLA